MTPLAMRPGPPSFSLAKTKIVSPLAMCLPPYIVFCAVNANVSAHRSLTSALIANIIVFVSHHYFPWMSMDPGKTHRLLRPRTLHLTRQRMEPAGSGATWTGSPKGVFAERKHHKPRQGVVASRLNLSGKWGEPAREFFRSWLHRLVRWLVRHALGLSTGPTDG